MKILKAAGSFFLMLLITQVAFTQRDAKLVPERCGTMQNLALQWEANPALKKQFDAERTRFNQALRSGAYRRAAINQQQQGANRAFITIPVVFHIVMTNPGVVTDAQIMAQLDTLNKDYAGVNGDTVRIPPYFKTLFGQSGIQFCLAQQTPNGEPTNGIERISTSKTSFLNTDNGVKHASTGGAEVWDPASYMNVWICHLSNSILGYATFPGSLPDNEQGVVIEANALPGGSLPTYNGGKTLTHESGHYFNLYHIWGDDNGACTGTDDIDDTPNQANFSSACSSGIVTDNCTPTGNGIMYQNFMDYTYDNCLVMFTKQQVARMESALVAYRYSLLSSVGCQPAVSYNLDAQLKSINQPSLQRVCSNPFTPQVTIRNRGTQPLTALTLTSVLDNTTSSTSTWTGSLQQLGTADISLKPVTATDGNHVLKIYVSAPNNGTDQNTVNDSLTINFVYNTPVTAVAESFEGSSFPPTGWDIVNPDGGITWHKAAGVAKTGNASVVMENINYSAVGQQDYLRLPVVTLDTFSRKLDSAFIDFQVAAAVYSSPQTVNNTWDTLEVLASTDCGQTYTSVYKKWGAGLITRTTATTSSFVPAQAEWRQDTVNISNYIGSPNLLLAFRNTTGFENNIYLDDINVRTVTVNPNLKSKGFLVTPSPTNGRIDVQFYPQPTSLKGIEVFNMNGQKVAEVVTTAQSNRYTLNISRNAAGIYIVRIVTAGGIMTRKIVKY